MINTQDQYARTRHWAERFQCSIQEASVTPLEIPNVDPRMKEVIISGMRCQLQDLLDEMQEYEARHPEAKLRLAT